MENSDDVRSFYSQASDATWAFDQRLEQAVNSVEQGIPNYIGLTEALNLLPLSSAITIIIRHRDKLVHLIQSKGRIGDSRRLFLSKLWSIARVSGDSELAGMVTCSYVLEVVNSTLLKPKEYTSGLNLLSAVKDDVSISRNIRAEASLSIAKIYFNCGLLKEAVKEVHNVLLLSRIDDILTRCFEIIGDIDMARGMYRQAKKKYKRARFHDSRRGKQNKYVQVQTAKQILADTISGATVATIEELQNALPGIKSELVEDIIFVNLLLETMKQSGFHYPFKVYQKLFDKLSGLPSMWRFCCKLSISIADYLIENNKYDQACKYLDYVMKMATQYENPIDTIDVFLLSGKACWCQGRSLEALRAMHIVCNILKDQRHIGKFGLIYLLRAKVAFYRNKIQRAVRLSLKASDIFMKGEDYHNYIQVLLLVAAANIWVGRAYKGHDLIKSALNTQLLERVEPKTLMVLYVVLSSACYADNKLEEAEVWLRKGKKIAGFHSTPEVYSLKYLVKSESYCYQQAYGEAKYNAMLAIEYAEKTDYCLIIGICRYQHIKTLILGKEYKSAEESLETAKRYYPYLSQIMWNSLVEIIKKDEANQSDFKPVGAFLI